ncbi:MAG: glutathione S-transferase [Desulfofustis sp.]|nr:glutathione S-transferase [Desulfofustis sp.]NNK13569.1 glutathione S-transferase [Desulfofustis sp.]
MKLLEFPHSHYCEKARWALDYKRIPFERVALMPGFHMRTVRRHAPRTSVPVLLTDKEVVQGSSEIIDYLDERFSDRQLTPQDSLSKNECIQFESELSDKFGEPLRTILYDRLLAFPDYIRFCFTNPMSPAKRILFRLYYPMLKKLMHQAYVKSEKRVAGAKETFFSSLDELEARISGNDYLYEGRFTRADLTVCAMLALLVLPPEFPVSWPEMPDHEIEKLHNDYQNHPVCVWVRRIYALHRN